LNEWLETPLGRYIVREETVLAHTAFEDVFGFDLLQIGSWGPDNFLRHEARTQRATVISEDPLPPFDIRAELAALPIASAGVDAVLLPHTLELVDDPYSVLREADRVLRPDGLLLILGFNPWSGWGLRRLAARGLERPVFPPGFKRMISEARARDWVALLGFDVDQSSGYLGLLPMARAGVEPRYRQRPGIMCGGYLLKARKRVETLTALRPKWRARQRVIVGAAEPTPKLRH
jgi:SAM-dependent methyltransferase